MLGSPELKDILESDFQSLKITKDALSKAFYYGRLLEDMVGHPKEYHGCMAKPKEQKEMIVSDIVLPYHLESSGSHVKFSGVADLIRRCELGMLGYQMIGENHHHGRHATRPSPQDVSQRKRILNAVFIKNFYRNKGVRSGGTLIKSRTVERFGSKKIIVETSNPFLHEIEIRAKSHKTFLSSTRKIFNYLNPLLKTIGIDITDLEDIQNEKIDFTIHSSIAIGYAYHMITNRFGDKYAELVYKPICRSCGPLSLRFKPLEIEVVEDSEEIELDQKQLKEELKKKVLSPPPDFETWKKSVGL